MTAEITVTGIYRYPVKGLTPQALPSVRLEQDETIPFDRAYAIENGPSRFDPANPAHRPKITFLTLMRDERLAALKTTFDETTEVLTIARGGKVIVRGDLKTRTGCALIEQFLAAYMKDSLRGPPRIIHAPGHNFTDVAEKYVHIVNLTTLAELERAMGRKLDPLRFRPNIVIAGAPVWSEFTWLGRELRLGSAGVRVVVTERVDRCAATNVDPDTGNRDADIPAFLRRQWGHIDFGVYARVSERGQLAVGDAVTLPATAPA